jgi:hypothetical protein
MLETTFIHLVLPKKYFLIITLQEQNLTHVGHFIVMNYCYCYSFVFDKISIFLNLENRFLLL